MSWSIEEHIGEGRPWPEQVVVYRGETDESLTYARRSLSDVNKMVELMDTLAAENAKLRELVRWAAMILTGIFPYVDYSRCPALEAVAAWKVEASKLGIEADDGGFEGGRSFHGRVLGISGSRILAWIIRRVA